MILPRHDCSLTLQHNPGRDYYLTAREWWQEEEERNSDNPLYSWESDEAQERALTTNEVWTLHWYPNTPISFHCIAAPTLEELLSFAAKTEAKD
jgi:hypothetical protein